MQRIYGTAFPNQKELDEYLEPLEEAEKRDHRRLGRELDLFSFDEEVGPGFRSGTRRGIAVVNGIEASGAASTCERGYQIVYTPHIARTKLWKASGHWDTTTRTCTSREIEERALPRSSP